MRAKAGFTEGLRRFEVRERNTISGGIENI